MARNIKLTVSYDGSEYHGFVHQPGLRTVQGELSCALSKLTGQILKITGSSRTDAGVHALGQVVNFRIDSPIPTENFPQALTNLLPQDIAVLSAQQVADSFCPIGDTLSKLYRYSIFTSLHRPVMDIRYCWHRPGALDIASMQQGCGLIVGKKDFKSFASAADERKSSVRTVISCRARQMENWIYIDIRADGFLYNMVRNIAGTLVEVGRGRWCAGKVADIIEARDRSAAGPLAPASGLCLMEIQYPGQTEI